jgi:Uma2 family endonuclease
MSTIAPTQPRAASPPPPGWAPGTPYRLTVDQYEAMVDAGVFAARDKVHLINGHLVAKMTQNTPHVTADLLCGAALDRLVVPAGWHVRPGAPVRLPGQSSEPEPDRSVARGSVRDYLGRHPGASDLALVVEVSESSLDDDRVMAGIYGAAGIPVYWIVNLIDGQVEVYSTPGPAGYSSFEVLAPGHVLSVMLDGVEVGRIAVDDVLP